MASEGGGKIKSKRGHSSSKPYQRRKSLFSRITDSIKEVLRPSWLATDDAQAPSVGDPSAVSDVNEEEEEFVSPAQSPSQLPGLSNLVKTATSSQQDFHRGGVPGATDSSLQWLQRSQASSTWDSRSGTSRTTWGNSASTFDKSHFSSSFFAQRLAAGNKPADNAVETTSRGLGGVGPDPATPGPSSSAYERLGRQSAVGDSLAAAPHGRLGHNSGGTDSMRASTSSSPEPAEEDNPSKRQRLWSPDNPHSRQSLQSPAYRPAFKMSVFSAPRLNNSMHESSFYSGKTAFGGASAYRSSLNSSLPYQNALPIRKSVKAKPLNNSGNAVLSSTATQILKTLERLSDTKRERVNETTTESLLSFTPTSYRKPSRPLQTSLPSRSLEMSVRGPPIQLRQSPVPATIAKNRQIVSLPSQRSQLPPPSTSTQRIEEQSEEEEEEEEVEQEQQRRAVPQRSELTELASSRSSGKMKHAKSYDTRGRKRKPSREEDDVVEIPNLRTDFTLPISTMPTFSLGFPSFSPGPPTTTTITTITSRAQSGAASSSSSTSVGASHGSNVTGPPKLQFTFSSPIHKSAPGPVQQSSSPVTDFQFRNPLTVSDSVSGERQSSPATAGFNMVTAALTPNPPAWGSTQARPKATTAGNSPASPAAGLGKVTSPTTFGLSPVSSAVSSTPTFGASSELKSGSVMDILGKGSAASPSPAFQAARGLKQGSVMDVLGGKNDGGGGGKMGTPTSVLSQGSVMDILGKSASASSPSSSDSLMAKFGPPAGSWECGTCMVQNTARFDTCVACSTARPQTTPVTGTSGSKPSGGSSSDSVFAKFAPAAGSWECEACMVQNTADVHRCVACQTSRPAPVTGTSGSKPSGGSSSDSVFAKFAPAAGSWECEACMVQNTADVHRCVACQTSRPAPVSSTPKTSSSGQDNLFAKFSAPAGSWECGGCLLQNKPEASKCVACDTAKPGSATSSPSAGSDSLKRFKRPAGGWDCDVCLVQNKGGHTKCVACQSPRPGAMSTGTVPPPAPVVQPASGGGMTFNLPSTPSSSPFLAASSSSTGASTFGFKMTSTASPSPAGGFQPGASPATGGFKFGQQGASSSSPPSSTSASTAGFSFGAKDSSSNASGSGSDARSVSSTSSGFQFGVSASSSGGGGGGGFVFGSLASSTSTAPPTTTTTTTSSSSSLSATPCVNASGFSGGSAAGGEGFQFGTVAPDAQSDASKVSSSESVGRTGANIFSPVFGGGKPGNSLALGAAPSSDGSVTAGGFQFQGPGGKDSAQSPFASGPAAPASTVPKTPSGGGAALGKHSSTAGGFNFASSSSDAAAKPGLFASADGDSSKKNGLGGGGAVQGSQGLMFGAASSGGGGLASNPFSSVPQLSSAGFAPSKLPVNGEVGAPGPFSFGQAAAPSGTAGFTFRGGSAAGKDNGGGGSSSSSSLAQAKPFAFGADAATAGSKSGTEKRHRENDVGPSDAKKRPDSSGQSSSGGGEGFKFGNSASGAGSNLFKFSHTSQGPQDKVGSVSTFASQASGFGASTQSGFNFPMPSNAASSTGLQQPSSVFGAGAGSGQFSFGLAAGAQSNAAAASPFGSDAPAPAQGFNFSGVNQSSFNFGANSTTSAPFQFGSSQSTGDSAPFLFGPPQPSADSMAPPPAYAPANPAGFGASPAQNSFNIGTGDGPRKIKRAVRRTVRK